MKEHSGSSSATEAKLTERIQTVIDATEGNLVVNAGHFLLVHDRLTDDVIPAIVEEISNATLKKEIFDVVGNFPSATFESGVKIAKHAIENRREVKMTLLVNDWQYIKSDPHRENSQPNRYRATFYSGFDSPPDVYQAYLKKYGIDGKDIWIGSGDDAFFFRETRLRDRFKRELKRLNVQDISLGTCSISESGNPKSFFFSNSTITPGNHLIKNGKVSCAGEIVQMIRELVESHKANTIINFLPIQCRFPVNLGAQISMDLYELKKLTILNIFPNKIGGEIEETDYLFDLFSN